MEVVEGVLQRVLDALKASKNQRTVTSQSKKKQCHRQNSRNWAMRIARVGRVWCRAGRTRTRRWWGSVLCCSRARVTCPAPGPCLTASRFTYCLSTRKKRETTRIVANKLRKGNSLFPAAYRTLPAVSSGRKGVTKLSRLFQLVPDVLDGRPGYLCTC